MMHRLRQRALSQRALWVLLLLLAVVVRPALAGVTDVHEATHVLQTGHLFEAHDAHEIPDDEPAEADDDAWHAAMHAQHCCGAPTAMVASAIGFATLRLDGQPPATLPAHVPASSHEQPLRPPIRG